MTSDLMSPPKPAIPPAPQVISAGSIIPDPGTHVIVPMAPASGEPGAAVVAVTTHPWYESTTIWSGLSLLGGSVIDAIINVLMPLLSSDQALDPKKLWRPCLVAAIGAYIAYRRKTDNSVIGSGASAS